MKASADPGSIGSKDVCVPWLPVLLAVIIFLGGGTPLWVKGGVLLALGIALFVRPPQRSIGRVFDWALAGLLLVSLLALLPASLLPHGAWRDEAVQLYGLDLGWMLASSPQALFEQALFLLGVFAWFYLLMDCSVDHRSRKKALCIYVFCMLVLALGMIVGNALGFKYYFAQDSTVFSYFPNRNQTSTTFCMAAISAFGLCIYGFRYKNIRFALLCALALVPLFVALLLSISRGGILLFFVGCIAVFAFKPLKHKWRVFLCLVLPVSVIIVCFAFLNQGPVMQRFEALIEQKGDYRLDVYQDTLHLIFDHPISGVGLGAFSSVFPQYEEKAAIDQRLLHPESDWFWFVAEVGLGGFFLLLLLLVLFVRAIFPIHHGNEETLRIIPIAAISAFLLHSLFDVPAHRLGTLFIAAFLFRLACKDDALVPCSYSKYLFRLAGIVLALSGVAWIAASLGIYDLHSETRLLHDDLAVRSAAQNQDVPALNKSVEAFIDQRPLDWWPYFERGRARLVYDNNIPGAEEDFARARFLQPTAQELTYYEGLLWLSYSPSRAFDAWSDALNRKALNPGGLYENMRREGSQFPNFKTYLRNLTFQDPAFRFYFLMHSEDYVFNSEMTWQIENKIDFSGFSETQLSTVLFRWCKVGDPNRVLAYLEAHPGILSQVPCMEAYVLARQGEDKDASERLLAYLSEPDFPLIPERRDLPAIERSFVKNPDNIWDGTALLQHYIQEGDASSAIRVAEKLSVVNNAPSYVFYWKARLYTELGDYASAWPAWEAYLSLGGEGFLCPKKNAAHSAVQPQ